MRAVRRGWPPTTVIAANIKVVGSRFAVKRTGYLEEVRIQAEKRADPVGLICERKPCPDKIHRCRWVSEDQAVRQRTASNVRGGSVVGKNIVNTSAADIHGAGINANSRLKIPTADIESAAVVASGKVMTSATDIHDVALVALGILNTPTANVQGASIGIVNTATADIQRTTIQALGTVNTATADIERAAVVAYGVGNTPATDTHRTAVVAVGSGNTSTTDAHSATLVAVGSGNTPAADVDSAVLPTNGFGNTTPTDVRCAAVITIGGGKSSTTGDVQGAAVATKGSLANTYTIEVHDAAVVTNCHDHTPAGDVRGTVVPALGNVNTRTAAIGAMVAEHIQAEIIIFSIGIPGSDSRKGRAGVYSQRDSPAALGERAGVSADEHFVAGNVTAEGVIAGHVITGAELRELGAGGRGDGGQCGDGESEPNETLRHGECSFLGKAWDSIEAARLVA